MPSTRPAIRPLAELATFFRSWIGDLRRRRDWRNLLDAEAADSIRDDAACDQQAAARAAYTAEQADLEAARLLAAALADGRVTRAEVHDLRTALRHIRHSARHDHAIAARLAP